MSKENSMNTLTAAEITNLWNTYLNDSGALCQMKFKLNHVEDEEIKSVLQTAHDMSASRMEKVKAFLQKESYPLPHGFKVEEDVDADAPKLFTDIFCINVANQMGRIGLNNFSTAITNAVREDIFEFFNTCLNESVQLIDMARKVLLSKGLFSNSPYLPKPDSYDFVEDKSFLAGYFKDKRPLTGSEIMNLYSNYERNALGAAKMMGYSQTCKSKEVTEFLLKGKEIANKHCEIFGSILKDNDCPEPMTFHAEVTDSTTYVYSERLMMFYSSTLIGLSIAYYGSSMATSPRRDIGTTYSRLIAELLKYADEGTRIMIKNGWLEEPPRSVDRDELAKKNN